MSGKGRKGHEALSQSHLHTHIIQGRESFTPPYAHENQEALFWEALVAAPRGAGYPRDPSLQVLNFLLIYVC